jgi:hypothetical protein
MPDYRVTERTSGEVIEESWADSPEDAIDWVLECYPALSEADLIVAQVPFDEDCTHADSRVCQALGHGGDFPS